MSHPSSTPTRPTLSEVAAWARDLVAFQRRQSATLVETGRLTQSEADRRLSLGEAMLDHLSARPAQAPLLSVPNESADAAQTPSLVVRVQCGVAVEEITMQRADLIAGDLQLMTGAQRAVLQIVSTALRNGVRR